MDFFLIFLVIFAFILIGLQKKLQNMSKIKVTVFEIIKWILYSMQMFASEAKSDMSNTKTEKITLSIFQFFFVTFRFHVH